MSPAPSTTRNRRSLAPGHRHRALRALVATGTLVATAAFPTVARGSSLPQAGLVPSATSPLCTEVSATAVSRVVGHPLPAAVATSSTVTNKKLNITGTFVDCTYGTYAVGNPTVDLVYTTLSKAVPLSTFEHVILGTVKQMPGTHLTVKSYAGLGEPALLLTMSGKAGNYSISSEEIIAINGEKDAGAGVGEMALLPKMAASLSLSKVAALAKLAMAKFF